MICGRKQRKSSCNILTCFVVRNIQNIYIYLSIYYEVNLNKSSRIVCLNTVKSYYRFSTTNISMPIFIVLSDLQACKHAILKLHLICPSMMYLNLDVLSRTKSSEQCKHDVYPPRKSWYTRLMQSSLNPAMFCLVFNPHIVPCNVRSS